MTPLPASDAADINYWFEFLTFKILAGGDAGAPRSLHFLDYDGGGKAIRSMLLYDLFHLLIVTAMTATPRNVDPGEIAKFSELASRWWDPDSEFKPLHAINPLRLEFIDQRAQLPGKRVLDVGCGGGILAESMAARGAAVVGIDMGEAPLSVARLHLLESGLDVDYRCITVEELAELEPAGFDVVTCMEMLEHVPDPASVAQACARLVKPAGQIFLFYGNVQLF